MVAPVDHTKPKGGWLPLTAKSILPSAKPQVGATDVLENTGPTGSKSVTIESGKSACKLMAQSKIYPLSCAKVSVTFTVQLPFSDVPNKPKKDCLGA